VRPRLDCDAPELAHLHVLLAALDTLDVSLVAEHPTILDPGPRPPATLRRALFLREAISTLRREVLGYRRAVLRVVRPCRAWRLRR
jgi:hypothetical protein